MINIPQNVLLLPGTATDVGKYVHPQGCVAKFQASYKTRFCITKSNKSSTLVTIAVFIVVLSKPQTKNTKISN